MNRSFRHRAPVPAVLTALALLGAPGARAATPRVHAIVGARIVTAPGQVIEHGTIVVRDGVITAVGADVQPPADARIWESDSLTVYPGLIDAFVQPPPPSPTGRTEGSRPPAPSQQARVS